MLKKSNLMFSSQRDLPLKQKNTEIEKVVLKWICHYPVPSIWVQVLGSGPNSNHNDVLPATRKAESCLPTFYGW